MATRNNNNNTESAWRCICIAHAVRCLADRSWSFFLPLYFSRQCPDGSLRVTAAISMAQNLAVATLSTPVANYYKRHRKAFVWSTMLENVAVALGGLCISSFVTDSSLGANRCHEPFHSNYFILALFCGSVDAIFSSLLSMKLSKEWVAVLFRSDATKEESSKNHRLARTNATLSQIDLGVAAASPLVVSFCIGHVGGYSQMLIVMVSQHVFGAAIIVYCVRHALRLFPALLTTSLSTITEKEEEEESPSKENNTKDVDQNETQQGVYETLSVLRHEIPVSTQLSVVAYILLYFTILSPGAVLNAWLNSLKHIDITENTIAYFGSASQTCGALATIIAPLLIRSCSSLFMAGAVAQWFQTACVLCAVACFHRLSHIEYHHHENHHGGSDPVDSHSHVLLFGFLFGVGLSRVGLWTFDLVERQIVQESVPQTQQTLFFNAERGAAKLTSLGMMYVCYLFPDSISLLVNLSMVAVCLASVVLLFCSFSPRSKLKKS